MQLFHILIYAQRNISNENVYPRTLEFCFKFIVSSRCIFETFSNVTHLVACFSPSGEINVLSFC